MTASKTKDKQQHNQQFTNMVGVFVCHQKTELPLVNAKNVK
jgi:hypothetical protein